MTQAALFYSWRELARRAGVVEKYSAGHGFESLSVTVCYDRLDATYAKHPDIVVIPCAKHSWPDLLERPKHSLDWLSQDQVLPTGASLPLSDSIPALFWGEGYEDGHKPFAERCKDGTVVFYVDIIATTLFMLTRWEETVLPDRDEHDRFPAMASVAYKQGFLDRPIVDEYALILRKWLQLLLPRWQPQPRRFSVKLTHDVDSLRNFTNLPWGVRTFAGDLLKRRDVRLAGQTFLDLVQQIARPETMDHFKGITDLIAISRENGLKQGAFYVMTAGRRFMQSDYDVYSPLLRRVLCDLCAQGVEIGLHAGYTTLNNPEQLGREKARLDDLLGKTHYGGRQHYLRFKAPDTWHHWAAVGLTYDATLGYAKHEGFRCGTCHPFHPFDFAHNIELPLWEYPLIVMDGTLKHHRQLTPEQGEQHILELARRCQAVEGDFILLWHNSSLHRDWLPWAEMYNRVVKQLAAL